MVLGKKVAFFYLEWGRNSAHREGQKIPWKTSLSGLTNGHQSITKAHVDCLAQVCQLKKELVHVGGGKGKGTLYFKQYYPTHPQLLVNHQPLATVYKQHPLIYPATQRIDRVHTGKIV